MKMKSDNWGFGVWKGWNWSGATATLSPAWITYSAVVDIIFTICDSVCLLLF